MMRTSNSESIIYERRQTKKNLDPRIYPSWWGEDSNMQSAARRPPPQKKVPVESSLERGMREIRQTAENLDRNIKMMRQGTEPAAQESARNEHNGFGSSFRPDPTQQRV